MSVSFQLHNDTPMFPCDFCGAPKKTDEQRWHLSDYYGFSGTCCYECYQKISHDSYGNPNNPEEYLMMVMKQNITRIHERHLR